MRWTKTLIPTLRQTPAEAAVPSHQLMLRAGLIQQVASGAYTYLPLGYRVLRKVMAIIREEMDRAGAVEVFMPALQPIELWERTGRRADYGENLFVVKDRHGRENALGPTHEEVVTELVKASVHSYRDLPITLYQIQTKFRDEFRPRFGVLRSREFQMKDAYSFDLTPEGLDRSYDAIYDAYCRTFERCGLEYVVVEAESGPIGGSASHEFMIPSPTGEDVILSSDKGNYAANVEKCETGNRPSSFDGEPTGDLTEIETPGVQSISELIAFFKTQLKSKLKPENTLKTIVLKTNKPPEYAYHWVVAVVRGDHELNLTKCANHVKAHLRRTFAPTGGSSPFDDLTMQIADEAEARKAGFAVGYVGPHAVQGRSDTFLVVDFDAAPQSDKPTFWVTGANKDNYHVRGFNWRRDVDDLGHTECLRADIRNAAAGDPSPRNDGGVLRESRGIEVGHVFKLGTKYSDALGLRVLDEKQAERPVIMGCYGIGANRIMAAAIEAGAGHDDAGIVWPVAIAPYHVLITPLRYTPGGDVQQTADRLYDELTEAGVEVLLDDRDERPGVKFKDADLIGIPLRITIGEKGLASGEVELKPRAAKDPEMLAVDAAAARVMDLLDGAATSGTGVLPARRDRRATGPTP